MCRRGERRMGGGEGCVEGEIGVCRRGDRRM